MLLTAEKGNPWMLFHQIFIGFPNPKFPFLEINLEFPFHHRPRLYTKSLRFMNSNKIIKQWKMFLSIHPRATIVLASLRNIIKWLDGAYNSTRRIHIIWQCRKLSARGKTNKIHQNDERLKREGESASFMIGRRIFLWKSGFLETRNGHRMCLNII